MASLFSSFSSLIIFFLKEEFENKYLSLLKKSDDNEYKEKELKEKRDISINTDRDSDKDKYILKNSQAYKNGTEINNIYSPINYVNIKLCM